MEWKEKTVLITGATSGVGEMIARRFLKEGARVCGCGRRSVCHISDDNFFYARGDLTKEEEAFGVVESCIRQFGSLDILVNCAGVTGIGGISDTSCAEFRRQFEINVFGLYYITKAAVPYLREGKESCIINIGSELGTKAKAQRIAYCPSKAAVEMLTKCLAIECGPEIRVNGVLPGLMETPMTRERFAAAVDPDAERKKVAQGYIMKRMCQVEDVVDAVMFLAGPHSKFITGDMIAVCGGGHIITCVD